MASRALVSACRDVRDRQLEAAGPDDLRVVEDRHLVAVVAGLGAGSGRGGGLAADALAFAARGTAGRRPAGAADAPAPPNGADAAEPLQAAAIAASIVRKRTVAADRPGRRPRLGLRIARSSMCPPG